MSEAKSMTTDATRPMAFSEIFGSGWTADKEKCAQLAALLAERARIVPTDPAREALAELLFNLANEGRGNVEVLRDLVDWDQHDPSDELAQKMISAIERVIWSVDRMKSIASS